MNADIKKKWIEALRSGQYEQGRSYLRTEHPSGAARHCCLGVLCELYMQAHPRAQWEAGDTDGHEGWRVYSLDRSDGLLPDVVIAWAEIDQQLGIGDMYVRIDGTREVTLTRLNDGFPGDARQPAIDPHNFEQIARLVEEQL